MRAIQTSIGSQELLRGVLKKYSALFFFENLVDFNEAHLNDATLNIHTHA